jgi:hypothetical protein
MARSRLALIAVALTACFALAPPSMAAPVANACRVTAQSDELRPTTVQVSTATANDDAANVVLDNRAAHPIVAPTWYAKVTFVGSNPYRSGHIRIAGRRAIDYS